MGDIRTYLGRGTPSRRHLAGRLCQTCTRCWHTHFFPEQPVVQPAPAPIPSIPFPYPSREGAPQPSQANRIDCTNTTCFTKSGTRTQGSKSCIELKCKSCCIAAAENASRSGLSRAPCTIPGHQSDAVHSRPPISTPVSTFTSQASGALATTTHDGSADFQPRTIPAAQTIIPAAQSITQANTSTAGPFTPRTSSPEPYLSDGEDDGYDMTHMDAQPAAPMAAVTPTTQTPAAANMPPIPTAPTAAAGRSLAQPLPPAWTSIRAPAVQQRESGRTVKQQQFDMGEKQKKSITLVYWSKNGSKPLRIAYFVKTFPSLQLSGVASLLKIPEASLIDVWQGEWTLHPVDSSINVTTQQRLLLRLRLTIEDELSDCLELDDELESQPKRKLLVTKRRGETLVSPVKKVARLDTTSFPTPTKPSSLMQPLKTSNPSLSSLPPTVSPSHPASELPSPKKMVPKLWPHDFYACNIVRGLKNMKKLRPPHGKLTIKEAFKKGFPDARYTKTTFNKYQHHWDRCDDDELKELILSYGRSEKGLYRRFVKLFTRARKNPNPYTPTLSIPATHFCRSCRLILRGSRCFLFCCSRHLLVCHSRHVVGGRGGRGGSLHQGGGG
ncbi:hypothetical protein FPV67DRAFT_182093 [Lyophyllum atratum]|nr:hypothetical protein FPV67DRAFT_182093 [Lyophyllum atratum]